MRVTAVATAAVAVVGSSAFVAPPSLGSSITRTSRRDDGTDVAARCRSSASSPPRREKPSATAAAAVLFMGRKGADDANSSADDDEQEEQGGEEDEEGGPEFYDDFADLALSSSSSSSSPVVHDDLGPAPIGSADPEASSSSGFLAGLADRVRKSREAAVRKDAKVSRNWRSGNWEVRGFSLDRTDPVREAGAEAAREQQAGRGSGGGAGSAEEVGASYGSGSGASPRLRGDYGGGQEGGDSKKEEGGDEAAAPDVGPIHVSVVVPDQSQTGLHGHGFDTVAVGRTDGTVCIVRLGTEHLTKFTAVPKLKVEDPSSWEGSSSGEGGSEGGDAEKNNLGSDESGGDDDTASGGLTVSVETELVRSDVLRREMGEDSNLDDYDAPPPYPTEDPFGDLYSLDDDGGGGSDDEAAAVAAAAEVQDPGTPFEVLHQFQAHDPEHGRVTALLMDDRTIYTASGISGDVKVWTVPDTIASAETAEDVLTEEADGSNDDDDVRRTKKIIPVRSLSSGVHGGQIVSLETLSSEADPDDPNLLLSACEDGSFALWDLRTGDLVYSCQLLDEYSDPVSIMCADVDSTSPAIDSPTIYLGLSTGHVVGYVLSDVIDTASIGGTCPVPSCRYLAHDDASVTSIYCGGEGTIGMSAGVGGGGSSAKTNVVLTGGSDGSVKQWEIMARKLPASESSTETSAPSYKLEHWPRMSTQRMKRRAHLFKGHSGAVTALACTDPGKFLSAGADGTVRVWSPSKGTELFRFDGFTDSLRSLCLDSETLVTDGMGELVCLHDFNIDEMDLGEDYEFEF